MTVNASKFVEIRATWSFFLPFTLVIFFSSPPEMLSKIYDLLTLRRNFAAGARKRLRAGAMEAAALGWVALVTFYF